MKLAKVSSEKSEVQCSSCSFQIILKVLAGRSANTIYLLQSYTFPIYLSVEVHNFDVPGNYINVIGIDLILAEMLSIVGHKNILCFGSRSP